MTRRETLVLMLERYADLTETRFSGGSGEGTVPILPHSRECGVHRMARMCTCWRRSVVELDRCLAVMRERHRRQHMHLHGRYLLVSFSRRRNVRHRGEWLVGGNEAVVIPRFAPARPPDGLYGDVLVASWPGWVCLAEVEDAIDLLEGIYGVEPWLPGELAAA